MKHVTVEGIDCVSVIPLQVTDNGDRQQWPGAKLSKWWDGSLGDNNRCIVLRTIDVLFYRLNRKSDAALCLSRHNLITLNVLMRGIKKLYRLSLNNDGQSINRQTNNNGFTLLCCPRSLIIVFVCYCYLNNHSHSPIHTIHSPWKVSSQCFKFWNFFCWHIV